MPVNWPYPAWSPTRRDLRGRDQATGAPGRPRRDRKKINAARKAARRTRR